MLVALIAISFAWCNLSPVSAQQTLTKEGELEIKQGSPCTVHHSDQSTKGTYLGEHKDRLVVESQGLRTFIPVKNISWIEVPRR